MANQDRLDSRLRLLEAAADMFSENGYKGTSLRAIADRAGVSFQLIQHHFGNKQELWVAMLDYLYGCFAASSEILEFDPSQDLKSQFHQHLLHMMTVTQERVQLRRIVITEGFADSDRYREFIQLRARDFFETRLLPYFQRVQRHGLIGDWSAEQAALVWASAVTNYIVDNDIVEFLLKQPRQTPALRNSLVDLMFELFTREPAPVNASLRTGPETPSSTHSTPDGTASRFGKFRRDNVLLHPRAAESDEAASLIHENRRLKQLVGELMLENRLLSSRLAEHKA